MRWQNAADTFLKRCISSLEFAICAARRICRRSSQGGYRITIRMASFAPRRAVSRAWNGSASAMRSGILDPARQVDRRA